MKHKLITSSVFCLMFVIVSTVSCFAEPHLDPCPYRLEINSNCTMITPPIQCLWYEYGVFDMGNGSLVERGNLTNLNYDIWYFNFTQPPGDYMVQLCDGSTKEVRVAADEGNIMISVILGMIALIGLFVGLTVFFSGQKSGLTYFFFLGSFVFTTVLIFLVAIVSDQANLVYADTLWAVYRGMLITTFAMMLIVAYVLTRKAIEFRKARSINNDNYKDNLDG